ncbi:unnamed protein product [Penicillium glandicola]
MDLDTADLDTTDLVLQTALQEVEDGLRSLNGNANDGRAQIGDQDFALLQWQAELRERMRTHQDLRAAVQMSRQSRLNQAAILQDIHNREVNEAQEAPAPPVASGPPLSQALRGSLGLVSNAVSQAQAHQRVDITATSTVPSSGVLRECIACSESYPESDVIRNTCSHVYCQRCIIQLLQNCLADDSLFPPRCCRLPLPLEATRSIIDDGLWARLEEKSIEQKDQSRTYCSDPACSRYILPEHVRGTIATCRACNRQTRTLCKKVIHQGECNDDRAEVLELARAEGWQRCSNCSHLIELRSGCNHITCRCRYEFCYVCTTPWKKCECAHWDEARLQERAGLIAARNQPAPAPQAVEEAAQFLIEQHDCYHDGVWKRLDISAECEECGDLMPDFILECRDCGLQACNSCRMHRF